MHGLSEGLRERIVKRYEQGYKAGEVASHFEVSESSIYRFVKLARSGKSLIPKKPGGQQSIVEREGLHEIIAKLVQKDLEASLQM